MKITDLHTDYAEEDQLTAKMSADVKKEYNLLIVKEKKYMDEYTKARGPGQKQLALNNATDVRHTIMDFLYRHNLLSD